MLVPKLRFKREGGTSYPDIESLMLGERFTFKNGINASREAFRAEGIQCIGVSDVVKCLPITAKNVKGTVAISEEEIKKNIVNYGDILFQRSSETKEDIGHASVYYDKTPAVYNGFVICAKPDKLFYAPIYLHYALQHSRIRKQTVTLGAGTGQHYNIGQEGLARIKVIIPCLEEQQKIAEFLSEVDEVIMQSESEVSNLGRQKKAAMQKIFSLESRFLDSNGHNYPIWEEMKFADLYEEASEGSTPSTSVKDYYDNGSIPFVKIEDTVNKYINNVNTYITDKGLRSCSAWLIPKNSVIFTNGATIGNVAINTIPVTTKQGILGIIPKTFVTSEFLYYLLSDSNFQHEVYRRQAKGTFATIILKSLNEISVKIPCLEEQNKITGFLSAYDEAVSYAKQELEKWKELKKGLLQQMFI